MQIAHRINKLEKAMGIKNKLWAVFNINCYEDKLEETKARQCLVDQFVALGNPKPYGCVFINDVPDPSFKQEEKFLYSFTK